MVETPTQFLKWQADARRRSRYMYVLYGFCVLGTVLSFYLLVQIFFCSGLHIYYQKGQFHFVFHLWNPSVFFNTCVICGGIIFLSSWSKCRELAEGGKSVAESIGARPLLPCAKNFRERKLRNIVEEISIASGVPMPGIYLLDYDTTINAFAAGYTMADSVIGVTRGSLTYLKRDELQGVIAHEFSHILNGDIRIRTRLISLTYGRMFPISIAKFPFKAMGVLSEKLSTPFLVNFIFYLPVRGSILLFSFCSLLVGQVGLFFGRVLQAALTRERERLADATAIEFTRNPNGLGTALKKIGAFSWKMFLEGTGGLPEVDHLFFSAYSRSIWSKIFSTHPPLIQRVRRLDPKFDGIYTVIKLEPVEEPIEVVREIESKDAKHITSTIIPFPEDTPPSQYLLPLDQANEIIESLPDEVIELISEPVSTISLICSLALDNAGTIRIPQLDYIAQVYGKTILRKTEFIHPKVMFLSWGQKLAIATLAMPTLRQMSREQSLIFRDTLDTLIRLDDRVDLFEYCLFQNMNRILSEFFRAPIIHFKNRKCADMPEDCALLLSTLAYAERDCNDEIATHESAQNAFNQGVALLKLDGKTIELLPVEQCDTASLDTALENFRSLAPLYRQNLYLACEVIVTTTNGSINDEERDMLNLLAQVLELY